MSNIDSQSRKWQITINNPKEKGLTHEAIKETLAKFKSAIYWCMSDEIGGESNTYHTHIYIHNDSGVRFSTVKKRFPEAHLEMARGTSGENKDYVFKEGKWFNSEKGTTNLRETHEEYGTLPVERPGARNDLTDLLDMVKSGMTNYEIINEAPQYIDRIDKIEKVRQVILDERNGDKWRTLDVTYIWGKTGAGKTRGVMEQYGYRNVYRVTDYQHPFDGYKGQDVICFEEFRSSLPIEDMLKYLDGYPVDLPARYANKVACFTKVYIISNEDIRTLYPNVQRERPRTWEAFLRRVNVVQVYNGEAVAIFDAKEYIEDKWQFTDLDFKDIGA